MGMQGFDVGGWLGEAAPWIATAVGGGAGLKVLERIVGLVVGRADRREARAIEAKNADIQNEVLVTSTLREQIHDLYSRCDLLQERLDLANSRQLALQAELGTVKAENHAIRARDDQMRGYMAVLVGTTQRYHKLLGFPEEDLPKLPTWINEPLLGPTTGAPYEATQEKKP